MSTNLSRVLIVRGVLAVVIGVLGIGWPSITVGVLVLLFAFSAFVAAAADLVSAFHVEGVGPTLGYLALATLSALAGSAALLWPGATAVLLTWVVALWAFATGIGEIGLVARRGVAPGRRAVRVVGGSVSVVLGVALALHPDIGPLPLGILFGLFSTVHGITVLARVVTARGDRHPSPPDHHFPLLRN